MCGNSSLSSEAILVFEHWFLTYLVNFQICQLLITTLHLCIILQWLY